MQFAPPERLTFPLLLLLWFTLMLRRSLKWLLVLLLALPVLALLWITVFGWNWARGPIQDMALERSGRALVIGGDFDVSLRWPAPRIRAKAVTFANPPWAAEAQLVTADEVEFSIHLPALFRKRLVFPEVHLIRPVVFLERAADGRKTWLLDAVQQDETTRIPIGRLKMDRGKLGYDDAILNTRIRAELSTPPTPAGGADPGVVFSAKGLYKGLNLVAQGSGGSVIALHDESGPYPLSVDAKIGRTSIKASGTVTSLLKFSAIDMQLALRGDTLAALYPLIGIAQPETRPYAFEGRLVRTGSMWRYQKFAGQIGSSDLAGSMQIDLDRARPFMHGELVSQRLVFEDLGPLIGSRAPPALATSAAARKAASASSSPATKRIRDRTPASRNRMLPDLPFQTDRWNSVDADISLRAKTILHIKELPIENLSTRLKMQDSVLTLDPLDFGVAGGQLKGVVSLDGRQHPIQARAKIRAQKILLAKLFPTIDLTKTSIGQINGEFDLSGKGDSVGRMLATADGRVALVIANGEISKLLMEQIGLHLLEILQLTLTGDKNIQLRCGVADFSVKSGVMNANVLVLETEVSTVTGSGTIDLGTEKLDLILVPKTKSTSLVALRSPIHVRGTFSEPQAGIDKGAVALRGAGALALGLLNPLLALIPLVETGPGVANNCQNLIREAQTRAPLPAARTAGGSRALK